MVDLADVLHVAAKVGAHVALEVLEFVGLAALPG